MKHITHPRLLVAAAGLALLVLAGCQGERQPPTVAPSLTPNTVAQAATEAPTLAPTATPDPSPTPTATPAPTATATPTATPTPTALPQAIQLTTGGCCTQPFWSPDSQEVRFIDGELRAGERSMPWAELVHIAYLSRVQLFAAGYYRTEGIHWDHARAGLPGGNARNPHRQRALGRQRTLDRAGPRPNGAFLARPHPHRLVDHKQ